MEMKGHTLPDFNTKDTFVSRNVSFHEHIIPYMTQTSHSSQSWTYYPSSSTDQTTTTISSHDKYDQYNTYPSQHLINSQLNPSIFDILDISQTIQIPDINASNLPHIPDTTDQPVAPICAS